MLCNCENPIVSISGVWHMCWEGGYFEVAARRHAALAFRIRGSAVITAQGREYRVNTNDILYIPQGISYTARYTDTEMLVFHFVTAAPDKNVEVYSLSNCEEVHRLFLRAHFLWKNREPAYAVYTMSLLYQILGVILEKETKSKMPAHFLNAVSFVNVNYKRNDISIDWICTQVGIGKTAFRQLFKKYYGETPVQYITELRLEYARNLISGGMPVEEAAFESGFNDPKYFARVVKKRFGCTPRALKLYGK